VKRSGFWQTQVLAFLGYFPWQCAACQHKFVTNQRGGRRHRTADGAVPSPNNLPVGNS
jgi:hypothetical protein